MSAIKNISLYIPHIFANFSKEYVAKVFEDNEIGQVKNIDFVSKIGHDGKPFNAAYIHFDHWINNISAHNFQDRVIDQNKEARIMYEDPWFWIVLENKARKFISGNRKQCINLGDSNQISSQVTSPVKEKEHKNCPNAPVKAKSYSQATSVNLKLDSDFLDVMEKEFDETDYEMEEILGEMEVIEAAMEEEEENLYLVSIDSRYVETLEFENMDLRSQLMYYKNALCVEQIKTQTLAEAIGKFKKE
jgi:hypothetical protein